MDKEHSGRSVSNICLREIENSRVKGDLKEFWEKVEFHKKLTTRGELQIRALKLAKKNGLEAISSHILHGFIDKFDDEREEVTLIPLVDEPHLALWKPFFETIDRDRYETLSKHPKKGAEEVATENRVLKENLKRLKDVLRKTA